MHSSGKRHSGAQTRQAQRGRETDKRKKKERKKRKAKTACPSMARPRDSPSAWPLRPVPFSPVHRARKLSAVSGTTSVKSCEEETGQRARASRQGRHTAKEERRKEGKKERQKEGKPRTSNTMRPTTRPSMLMSKKQCTRASVISSQSLPPSRPQNDTNLRVRSLGILKLGRSCVTLRDSLAFHFQF